MQDYEPALKLVRGNVVENDEVGIAEEPQASTGDDSRAAGSCRSAVLCMSEQLMPA